MHSDFDDTSDLDDLLGGPVEPAAAAPEPAPEQTQPDGSVEQKLEQMQQAIAQLMGAIMQISDKVQALESDSRALPPAMSERSQADDEALAAEQAAREAEEAARAAAEAEADRVARIAHARELQAAKETRLERLREAERQETERQELLAAALAKLEAGEPLSVEEDAALAADIDLDDDPFASWPGDEPVEASDPMAEEAAAAEPVTVGADAPFEPAADGDPFSADADADADALESIFPAEEPVAEAGGLDELFGSGESQPADDSADGAFAAGEPSGGALDDLFGEPLAQAETQPAEEADPAQEPTASADQEAEDDGAADLLRRLQQRAEAYGSSESEPADIVEEYVPLASVAEVAAPVEEAAPAGFGYELEPLADEPPAAIAAVPGYATADLLWAVGRTDSAAEAAAQEKAAMNELRQTAVVEVSRAGAKKGKLPKIKAEEIPFHSIQPGRPLIITVCSPKGGVGKSTTAVNIGAYVAQVGREMARASSGGFKEPRVLVFDGDIANGNLAMRVAERVKPNLLDLDDWRADFDHYPPHFESQGNDRKDWGLEAFVLYHEELPNLNILAAPEHPDVYDDFEEDDYRELLEYLGQHYDVIVIDSGTEIVMKSNRVWLQFAHLVFLLTIPDIAALHSAAKYAQYVCKSGRETRDKNGNMIKQPPLITSDKVNVVLMRADADFGLDPKKVWNFFQWASEEHRFEFPDFDREAQQANNTGSFIALNNPRYAKSIANMVSTAFRRYGGGR